MKPTGDTSWSDRVEALLACPYWVIDLLPAQVPADGAGQFFAVERLLREEPHRSETRRRFAEVLLRLNCYHDFRVFCDDDESGTPNPDPRGLEELVLADRGMACILIDDGESLLTVPDDSTCMTLYDPAPALLELVEALATASGLFVWQPPQGAGD